MLSRATLLTVLVTAATGCASDGPDAGTTSTARMTTAARQVTYETVKAAFRNAGAPIVTFFQPQQADIVAVARGPDPTNGRGRPFYVLVAATQLAVRKYAHPQAFPVPAEEKSNYAARTARNVVVYVPTRLSGTGRAKIDKALDDIRRSS
jgi:hypothetical protein